MMDKGVEPRCQQQGSRDINPEPRLCRTCGEVKPASDFHKNASKAYGRDSQCRQCVIERKRELRRKRREREDIRLNINFSRSSKFGAAMEGILSLVCNEMVGTKCREEYQND